MLSFQKSSAELVDAEEAIINSNPLFNLISRNKEMISTEEVLDDIQQAHRIGAQRMLLKENQDYIGILEYLPVNPADQCSWLGLLLISGELQSKGYGSQAVVLFEEYIRSQGVSKYRIGVITKNTRAHLFWMRQEFKRINSKTNGNNKEILIYEKNLS
ncbi:GNAT family N-acetyltransferase [Paenibacillus profundus]|uniref:GNAT family N-acetyltransferase n=1 Tax=Paenibacillus profundus TaxID=1173085 RepID=A0ABS8YP69_9BACL|nr:GNAT family N-acetyltransferase [Paenibacillus profundus]MCE5173615.1 GNAT family N-acetyltransferase [Paenibacillus profundus]